jgi:hypothetical protein
MIRSTLAENFVEEVAEYLKMVSPKNESRSLMAEVMNKSCSPSEYDIPVLLTAVPTSAKPLIWVFWEKAQSDFEIRNHKRRVLKKVIDLIRMEKKWTCRNARFKKRALVPG